MDKGFSDIRSGKGERIETQGDYAAGCKDFLPDRQDTPEKTLQGIRTAAGLGRVLNPVGKIRGDNMGFPLPEKGGGIHRVRTGKTESAAIT